MTPRPRSPVWAIVVVVAGIGALVAGLGWLRAASPPDPPPAPLVDLPEAAVPEVCARDGDPETLEVVRTGIRSGLGADRRVSSAAVLACPAAYDGRTVRYVGELVGDLLHRPGGAWVLVNDDAYALEVGPLPSHGEYRGVNAGLTVWVPDDELPDDTGLGRPGRRGDVVAITGEIVRADPDDGGGLTLRAAQLEVLRGATAVGETLDVPQAITAATLTLLAGCLWLLRRRSSV